MYCDSRSPFSSGSGAVGDLTGWLDREHDEDMTYPTHRATIEQLDRDGNVYRTSVRHGFAADLIRSIEAGYNMAHTRLTVKAL